MEPKTLMGKKAMRRWAGRGGRARGPMGRNNSHIPVAQFSSHYQISRGFVLVSSSESFVLPTMEVVDVGSVRPRRLAHCKSPLPDTYQPELSCIARR